MQFTQSFLAVGTALRTLLPAAVAAATLCTAGLAPAVAQDVIKTRYFLGVHESHPYGVGIRKMKEVLESESKGRMTLDIVVNAEAGDDSLKLQLLRSGSLHFAEISSSLAASGFARPVIEGWSLPFLYANAEAAHKAWDSDVARESYTAFDSSGFKCIERWNAGFRQLSSNKAINSVADVAGLKIRTPNGAIFIETWKALNGVPSPMPFGELYTALQTGVVDGTELPVQLVFSNKFFEVQSHQAIINYMNDPICFMVSARFIDGLEPELQEVVKKAAIAGRDAQRAATLSQYQSALDGLKAAGIVITEPNSEEFRNAVKPVYEAYYGKAGDEGRKLVESILKVADEK